MLVTGWFSFDTAEVTAGDLLAGQTVRRWLSDASIPHSVAVAANFRTGDEVGWTEVDPRRVDNLVFACGPAGGPLVEELMARFPDARKVGVGVSVVEATARLGLDRVIERDDGARATPDLAVGTATAPAPVVAVVRGHAQPEYGDRQRHHDAHAALDRLLLRTDVAPVAVDTRLHPGEAHLCSTPGQLVSALGRFDAIVTTRLHGLVLGLHARVPVLAIDPIDGGAKVRRQGEALGWPAVVGVEEADDDRLDRLLAWCLGDEARRRAQPGTATARLALVDTRDRFLDALAPAAAR